MMRGRLILGAIAAATVSACTTGGVEIRPIAGSPLTASNASERVIEGRAKLAIGSVALALESFRRALREDPSSVDALVGLAACYERMGRFDLSSTQYEAALSIAPADAALIDRLAASREAEGKTQQAADLRREAALRRATPQAIAPAAKTNDPVDIAMTRPTEPVAVTQAPSAIVAAPAPVAPIVPMPSAAAVAALVGQDNRLSSPIEPVTRDTPIRNRGPRLVRMSMGEIALVTTSGPLWEEPRPVVRTAARPAVIHLLNAARVAKLAARTRDNMSRRGWNDVSVGDAPAVLATSVIRYPVHARAAARRLADQYGFVAVADPSVRFITVYLGRDSVPTG